MEAKEYLKKVGIEDRVLNREDLSEYWKTISQLMEEYKNLKNPIPPSIGDSDSSQNKVYAIFDSGGQGMRNVGLMAIFDTEEKAKKEIGNSWCSIKEIQINKIYPSGM